MAGRGPAPGASPTRKPAGQRRRRNKEPELNSLPREGYDGPYPKLPAKYRTIIQHADGGRRPKQVPFLKATRDWYDTWATSPMATEFTGVHWRRLQHIARLVDQYERNPTEKLAGEIRLQEAGFGGTPMDLRRLGKTIAPAEGDATERQPLAEVRVPDARLPGRRADRGEVRDPRRRPRRRAVPPHRRDAAVPALALPARPGVTGRFVLSTAARSSSGRRSGARARSARRSSAPRPTPGPGALRRLGRRRRAGRPAVGRRRGSRSPRSARTRPTTSGARCADDRARRARRRHPRHRRDPDQPCPAAAGSSRSPLGRSRLGQRITFASRTRRTRGRSERRPKLADNQRRNLAGMGGRFARDHERVGPAEESVAQQTFEAASPASTFDDVEPGAGSVRNKARAPRMLKRRSTATRGGSTSTASTPRSSRCSPRPRAGRAVLPQPQAAGEAPRSTRPWARARRPATSSSRDGALIVIGVDGARFATRSRSSRPTSRPATSGRSGSGSAPRTPPDDYEHPLRRGRRRDDRRVRAVRRLARLRRPAVHRGTSRPLAGPLGREARHPWYTNRPKQIAWAVRNYVDAIGAGDLSHNGDPDFARTSRTRRSRSSTSTTTSTGRCTRSRRTGPDSPRKIDGAMAGVLSWEARGDAIAAGEAYWLVEPPRNGAELPADHR
jgi:hypothetical protein